MADDARKQDMVSGIYDRPAIFKLSLFVKGCFVRCI